MTILVTGGAGYIGSHTCVELLRDNYDLVVIDNFCNSKYEAIKRVEELVGKKIKFYEGDILDRDFLAKVFSENKIDSVIHFAGYKAVGESVILPWKYYYNNVSGTLILLETMEQFAVNELVFSSSATVYGFGQEMPLTETMPTSANSPYGQTKLIIEQILIDIAKARPEFRVSILRYFNPIGAHNSGKIGEDPNDIPNNLMPFITQVACGRLSTLKVFGNDYATNDGTGVRDYVHVVDLALGHISALKYLKIQDSNLEIFNLGTGIGYSVLDVVNTFSRVNHINIPYVIVERRTGDVEVCFADVTKAWTKLNWQALLSLEDMCRDSYRWQTTNPQGY